MSSRVIEAADSSKALVPYRPPEPLMSQLARRIEDAYKTAFNVAKYENVYLKHFGEGHIFVIIGQSTAGKTSILKELEKTIPKALAVDEDRYGFARLVEFTKEHAPPLLYARAEKALDPICIALYFDSGKNVDLLHWRSGISEADRIDALQALEEISQSMDPTLMPPSPEARERDRMDLVIKESQKQSLVAFDVWPNPYPFLEHCATQNFATSVKIGLAYCPFNELSRRVADRNAKALGKGGDPIEWRPPLLPLLQFPDFYRPAEKDEHVLETLHRTQVEQIFEAAWREEASVFHGRALTNPHAAEHYNALIRDYQKMKSGLLKDLGFIDDSVEQVAITPRFQRFDYLFNTKEMQPSQSADVVYSWLRHVTS